MITIIGAGKVGGDAALFSALKQLDDQILLLDIAEGLPQGEAMDLNHMLSEQGIDVNVKGSNNSWNHFLSFRRSQPKTKSIDKTRQPKKKPDNILTPCINTSL